MKGLWIPVLIGLFWMDGLARPDWVGYSGAPGRQSCAASCHGSGGGTIFVEGFPELYTPGETYELTIGRSSGNSIANFNASCRQGSGTTNAGTISSGSSTSTYNTNGETNGVHFTHNNQTSGTFSWTAPEAGTGSATLYVAGLQGSMSGVNTHLELVAVENTEAIFETQVPGQFELGNFPNPFNPETTIHWIQPTAQIVTVEVLNVNGAPVARPVSGEFYPAGEHALNWNAGPLASGVYQVRLTTENRQVVHPVIFMK